MSQKDASFKQGQKDGQQNKTADTSKMSPQERDAYLAGQNSVKK